MINEVLDAQEKQEIARGILEALPAWFGIPAAREEYIVDSAGQRFFAAVENGEPVGFACLKETGKDTVELAVIGVLKEFHRRGIGRELFSAVRENAARAQYSFLQVKTVQMGRCREYDATNRFYKSLGFREFEVFPTLWDARNPCQVYVMALR